MMNEKEFLKNLIDNPKQPNLTEWVYAVEGYLDETKENDVEAKQCIKTLKSPQGDAFNRSANLLALLKRLYKRKYDGIVIPPIKKRNQIFVAMMFNDEMDAIYQNVYKPTIQSQNFSALRIDEKQYNGSIIGEITTEITDSIALIADLTGNRGGVYYEAGIAKGLQLCNHPIQLIFTCSKDFFSTGGVHFDVKGDNIIIYSTEDELKQKLSARIKSVLHKGGEN
jgi:hypothetical protein